MGGRFLKRWLNAAILMGIAGGAQASVTEVGTVSNLTGGTNSAVIDTADGLAYFGSTIAVVFPSLGLGPTTALDAVDLNTFSLGTGVLVSSGPLTIDTAVLDPASKRVYVGGQPGAISNAVVVSVPVGVSPVFYSTVTLPSPGSTQHLTSAVFDAKLGHVLFGTFAQPAQIIEITSGTPVFIASTTLATGSSNLSAAALDPNGDFAYFGSSTTPGIVTKIKLSDLSVAGTLTFAAGEGGVASVLIDTTTGSAYFGTHDSPGKIIRVNLGTFLETGHLILQAGENDLTSAVSNGTMGYFGTNTAPGRVVQVRFSDLSEQGLGLTLPAGQNFLTAAVIEPSRNLAYFATHTTPGLVLKFDLIGGVPVILAQPQNVSAQAGQSASFLVQASGRNLTYQWQRNGVDISGATSTGYTLAGLTLSEDGDTFHCVVSNSSGTVTSTNAVLTVIPVVRVYPDPWRADRHAGVLITFDGLPQNSTVKIFTLSAHWVKSLSTNTGLATWDRTNDAGQLVATGYYYYAVTSSNNKQTVQGKLAIIK